MYPLDIRVTDPVEALVVEQALALVREMRRASNAAPDGQVLAKAEQIAVDQGRKLARQALEAVLNDQAGSVEKKGLQDERVPAAPRGRTTERGRGRC
jgi:hypothetical protein